MRTKKTKPAAIPCPKCGDDVSVERLLTLLAEKIESDHRTVETMLATLGGSGLTGTTKSKPTKHRARPRVNLSDADVRKIRKRVAAGDRVVDVAADFGASESNVYAIVAKRTRADVK